MFKKFLFVDDKSNVLRSFQRQLRNRYTFDVAEGALVGLKAVETTEPYAIVISDLPRYRYVLCDLTPSAVQRCKIHDAIRTSDGLGYFFCNKTYGAYVDVSDAVFDVISTFLASDAGRFVGEIETVTL